MEISEEEKQDIDQILSIKQFELESSAGACSNDFPNDLLSFALTYLNYSKYLNSGEKRINEGYMKRSIIKFHDKCEIITK